VKLVKRKRWYTYSWEVEYIVSVAIVYMRGKIQRKCRSANQESERNSIPRSENDDIVWAWWGYGKEVAKSQSKSTLK
jgi:hypothetical protein